MPKVTRVYDRQGDTMPLRITHRKGKAMRAPSIRIKCGCCNESVVIFPNDGPITDPHLDSININGVNGTIDQWRQVLCPMLGIEIPRPLPRPRKRETFESKAIRGTRNEALRE